MKNFWNYISKKDLIFGLIILVLVIVMSFKPSNKVRFYFEEDSVDIKTTKYSMNIPYDMVESVEIGQLDKDDEIIKGKGDIALRTGHCLNKDWGEYYGIIDLQTSKCVLIRLNDGRLFVYSHKSDEKVQQDCEMLLSHLNQ